MTCRCLHDVFTIMRLRAMGMAGSLWWDWGLQEIYDMPMSFNVILIPSRILPDASWRGFAKT